MLKLIFLIHQVTFTLHFKTFFQQEVFLLYFAVLLPKEYCPIPAVVYSVHPTISILFLLMNNYSLSPCDAYHKFPF